MRVLSQQDEWRRKIRERRAELAERFGPKTQARDFLALHGSAAHPTAAQTASAGSPEFDSLAAHGM
jgi:hypothetical protein